MSTTEIRPATTQPGGAFLLGETTSSFTPEDFTEEQQQIAATAARFMADEVYPIVSEFEQQQPGLARSLMQKAGELGLLAVRVPEKYGGLEMDMVTAQLVSENLGGYASFSWQEYPIPVSFTAQPLATGALQKTKNSEIPSK